MIKILKCSKSMRTFRSMVDVRNFRSDALEIPFSVLDSFADYKNQKISSIGLGIGIYQGDNIFSSYAFSSMDKVFFKKGHEVFEVRPEDMGLFDKSRLYIKSRVIGGRIDTSNPVKIAAMFGDDWQPEMSERAWRRCVAIRVLEHYTREMQPYAVEVDDRIPGLERLVPWANFYEWLRLKYPGIAQQFSEVDPKRPYSMPVLDISDEEFKHDRAVKLSGNIEKIMGYIDDFVSINDDCTFHFEVGPNSLLIFRGIDHKYLPYYENKFNGDDESTDFFGR